MPYFIHLSHTVFMAYPDVYRSFVHFVAAFSPDKCGSIAVTGPRNYGVGKDGARHALSVLSLADLSGNVVLYFRRVGAV
jgi:hypothetical protein